MTSSLALRAIAGTALTVLAFIGPAAAQPLPPGGQQFQQQPQFQQPQFQQQPQAPQQFQPPGQQQFQQPGQPQQNDAALQQFQQTLQQFGQFQQHPRYGFVWQPGPGVVPQGWKPYPPCAWSYDRQQQAWVYNDQTPWGQIVHHYGRWSLDPQMGWVWVADSNYGPGWVVWRSDAQTVSWAPLPPEQDQADPQVMQNPQIWHTAQAQGFNGQCGPSQPPMASSPPPPSGGGFVPAPVFAPRPVGPAFAPPPQVFVTRPPPPVIIDRPPPVIVVGGDPFCRRFPFHPRCRSGPGPGGFCQRFPDHPRCRGVGPGPNQFCQRFPNHPRCRVVGPGPNQFCQRFPNHPRCRAVLPRPNVRPFPGRPGPVVRPFPGRPGPVVRPFPGRPGRPGPVVRQFPNRGGPVIRPQTRPQTRPAVRPVIRQNNNVRRPNNNGRPFRQ